MDAYRNKNLATIGHQTSFNIKNAGNRLKKENSFGRAGRSWLLMRLSAMYSAFPLAALKMNSER